MIVSPQPSCHNRLKSLNSFSVSLSVVMAGLDPAIHGTRPGLGRHNEGMDHRVKPGDDDLKRVEYHQVTNIAATAPAIAPVDSHPMAQSGHQWHRHDAIDDGRPE